MLAGIHKEMAYQILLDHPKQSALEFLLAGISKPEWKKNDATKIKWLKEWMDMPDNSRHSSKMRNDHSYKLTKDCNRFRIVFAKTGGDQATVVSRLKYAARSANEWKVEEEYRTCAIEIAKSLHWIIDMCAPPHTTAGWGTKEHSKIESDFDKLWKKIYDKNKIKFDRKNAIDDIYKWAKRNIENHYDINIELHNIYKIGKTIKTGRGAELAEKVILNLAQNFADYIAYTNKRIKFDDAITKLPT